MLTADSQKLEYRPGTIDAGFPSSLGFGIGRLQMYASFELLGRKEHDSFAATPARLLVGKPSDAP